MGWDYKKAIAQRVWMHEKFDRFDFDKSFYTAVLTEMRRIGMYIQCGNMTKEDLKVCREFYLKNK